MNSVTNELKQIEGKVIEISRLQGLFSDKVLSQVYTTCNSYSTESSAVCVIIPQPECYFTHTALSFSALSYLLYCVGDHTNKIANSPITLQPW